MRPRAAHCRNNIGIEFLFNFDLQSAEPFGEQIVDRCADDTDNESKQSVKQWADNENRQTITVIIGRERLVPASRP
jgi:hypothetical protein